ncbi:hypothetical protein BJX63DRAFT_199942 [Aspergillus granulosus]|uniref:Wings apart-like protein C-terminal domain-containing protein n=1 Tax=Aspergillus granulosus TaxID=176169 RepID=A0ABR4HG74_9EURO
MPPTRSASSLSKKRSSTQEALDLLNSVMSRKDLTGDSRQTQSAQPIRQLRNLPRAPRRDIWEAPDSPERAQQPTSQTSPLAAAEPLTPLRRSTRLQNQVQTQSSPTVARTGAKAADVEHVEQNAEVEDSWHPSQQASGHESDDVEEESTGEDIDFYGNFNVFSDDASRTRSSSIRSPTPSAVLRQDLERAEQTQTTPRKPETPRRVAKVKSGEKRSTRLRPTSHRSTQNAAEPDPSLVIRRSPSKAHQTPIPKQKPLSNRLLRSHVQDDDDGDVEMVDDDSRPMNGHLSAPEDDTGSLSVSSDFSPSSSEAGEPSLPGTRSEKPRQPSQPLTLRSGKSVSRQLPEPLGPNFSWSPPPDPSIDALAESRASSSRHEEQTRKSPSQTPSTRTERSESLQTPEVRRRRRRSWWRITSSQKASEQESPYPRCKEALKFGQQEENWKALINAVRLMERHTDQAFAVHFQDILDLISHSQKWYENLPVDLGTSRSLTLKESRKSEKLLDSISGEGDEILDAVFYLVTKRKESSQERGLKLFQEFEARVIPALVHLIFAAFDAYHTDPQRFAPIYEHLHHALSLTLRFCNRMRSLTKEKYVQCITRSTNLLSPLQNIIEASESNALKKAEPESDSPSDQDGETSIPSDDDETFNPVLTHRPFSDAEGRALLDGLQQYQDPGRYILIHQNFSEFEGRTIRELREEAERICNEWVPLIQDELSTQDGRENWRWLLSVREWDS